jgi:4-hydroxy-3-methylbut-2-en-1-yl diphosphate reductase
MQYVKARKSGRGEAAALSNKVDMMLVVGGKNSSNTTRLYKVVHNMQPNTHHIETENNTNPERFKNVHTIGITGGSIYPDLIIDIVERRVKNL